MITGGTVSAYDSTFVNVKNFGAQGNGVADDSTAINNAIVFASANNMHVWFPTGTYLVNSSIVPLNNVRLLGAHRSLVTIKLGSAAARYIIFGTVTGLTDFTVEEITFEANNLGGCIMTADGMNRFSLLRCIFRGANVNSNNDYVSECCQLGNNTLNIASSTVNQQVNIRECVFTQNTVVNEVLILMNCSNSHVVACDFRQCLDAGFSLSIWGYCRNVVVSACKFYNNFGGDMYFQESDTIAITGCSFVRNSASPNVCMLSQNCSNVAITGCTFIDTTGHSEAFAIKDYGTTTFNPYNNPHKYQNSQFIRVSNCSFSGFVTAIYLPSLPAIEQAVTTQFTDIEVSDCTISNVNGAYGAQVGSDAIQNIQRVSFNNCKIVGDQSGTNTMLAGIIFRGNPGFTPTTITPTSVIEKPAAPTVTAVSSPGSTLPPGNYYVQQVYVSGTAMLGQSLPSVTTGPTAITAGQGLQITSPVAYGGAQGWIDYVSSDNVTFWRQQHAATPIGTNHIISTPLLTGTQNPPTVSLFEQTIAVGATATMKTGQWMTIENGGGNQEDASVVSITDATHIVSIVQKSHANGVAVQTSINNGANGGINDCRISGCKIVAGTAAGNNPGIQLGVTAGVDITQVAIESNDLTNAAHGTAKAISYVTAGSKSLSNRNNKGHNPYSKTLGAYLDTANANNCSPTVATTAMASGTPYTNISGYDVIVCFSAGTISAGNVDGLTGQIMSQATRVFVPNGSSITITWSVQPTWEWYAV